MNVGALVKVISFLMGALTGFLVVKFYYRYRVKIRRILKWVIMIRLVDKYPLSLKFLWFLMRLGIRTNGISSLAHRIYDEVEK